LSLRTGLYFFTFSARGQVDENRYYYEEIRNSHGLSEYTDAQNKYKPIVIDKSRDRHYYNPGKNNLVNEWE